MTGIHFTLNSSGPLIFGAEYGPLWGLVVLFTILGLVFIIKALECMGVSAWKAILPTRKKNIRKGHLIKGFREAPINRPVSGGIPSAIWTGVQHEGVAGIADAGEVLFPGQPSLAEALTRAYSEETGDEGLFALCCEEELEDILADVAEQKGQGPRRQEIPLAFLPVVTAQTQKDHSALLAKTALPEEEGDENREREGVKAIIENKPFPDLEFLPLIVEGEEEEQLLFEAGPPIAGHEEPDYSDLDPEEGVSIFEDLLNKCDTEAKLILLSELPAVGGLKELTLLKTLTLNENKRISKLARKLYRELKMQLECEADKAIPESMPGISDVMEGNYTGRESVQEEKRPLEYCFLREAADNYKGTTS